MKPHFKAGDILQYKPDPELYVMLLQPYLYYNEGFKWKFLILGRNTTGTLPEASLLSQNYRQVG